MTHTLPRRALALLLSCSPVLWLPDVVLAQSLRPQDGRQGVGTDSSAPSSGPAPQISPQLPPSELRMDGGDAQGAAPIPVDEPVDPEAYVCGPGDVFELSSWGLQNWRVKVAVDLEGRVFVPRIGFLTLGGKTLAEGRRLIREAVARNYPKVSFDVSLASPRSFIVHVAAGVAAPGAYRARATDRLSSVLAQAGGVSPFASRRRVEIRRRDGTSLEADLVRYALDGDVRNNPRLLDGDVVRVPFEEIAATIEGAVNRPGRYELIGKKDLAELVEIAGGLAMGATRRVPLTLVRRGEDEQRGLQTVPFGEDGALPPLELRHDDVVRVPDFNELQRFVSVSGALMGVPPPPPTGVVPDDPTGNPRLPFVEGETVRGLLRRAGGPGPLADLAGAYLLRAGKAVPVDLHTLLMLQDAQADRPVELGDTLVVPFKRRSVLVKGAVVTPGPYAFDPTFSVEQYLAQAGGRTRFARSLSNVRLITPDGETRSFRRDLVVPPGASVVVPERHFTPTEIVQIILSAASVMVSGVAVVLAARR